jgi:hypothetical protein
MSLFLDPAVILGVLLSAGYACLFHLWAGRNLRELFLYLLVALVGFALGQWIGQLARLDLWLLGRIHLLEASSVALLFLVSARLLLR